MNRITAWFGCRQIRKVRLARIKEAQAYLNKHDHVSMELLENKVCEILNVSKKQYSKEVKSYMISLIVHEYPEDRLLQELEKIDVKQEQTEKNYFIVMKIIKGHIQTHSLFSRTYRCYVIFENEVGEVRCKSGILTSLEIQASHDDSDYWKIALTGDDVEKEKAIEIFPEQEKLITEKWKLS